MRRLALLLGCLAACRPNSDPSQPPPALTFTADPAWPDKSSYPGVGQGRLLITNSREDTVSLFDVSKLGDATFPELARVPVGLNPVEIEAPHHAAVALDGKHYYVGLSKLAPGSGAGPHGAHGTGQADGEVLKIRTSDNRLVSSARVDRNPGDLVLSPDGKTIVVSHFDLLRISEAARGTAPDPDARLVLIDAETMERSGAIRVCPAPHGMKYSADGKKLYVACYSDEVAIVKMDDPTFPITRVKIASNAGDAFTATYQPYALSVSQVTGDVFVSCLVNGEVRVLSGATQTIDTARTARVGGTPVLSDFSADSATLYVPHQGDDRISVVDPATGNVTANLALPRDRCTNVHAVSVLPGGNLAVVCEGDHLGPGSLLIVDPAGTGTVVSATRVGVFPDYVGWVKP